MRPVGTCPVKITIGMESQYAVAMPVTVLVAPGPDVAMQTPTLPVARAYPSAVKQFIAQGYGTIATVASVGGVNGGLLVTYQNVA